MAFLRALSDYGSAMTSTVFAPTVSHRTTPAGATPRAAAAAREARPPFFRWREQWCVGIDALDRDRRAIAAILNYIAMRFSDGDGDGDGLEGTSLAAPRTAVEPSALHYWLAALRERARAHFAREEALMRMTHYPDTAEHAGEHALMLAECTTLIREIAARGDERLRLADLDALKQWFMGHVLDMDKHLGHYLRAHGISALPKQQMRRQMPRQMPQC